MIVQSVVAAFFAPNSPPE